MKEVRSVLFQVIPLSITVFVQLFCLSRCGIFNDENVVQKARCYANCLTMISKGGAPDVGCELKNNCTECLRGCDMVSRSLNDCNKACANSTWCEASCQYIQTTVKAWANIYNGDGTSIPKPPIPIATKREVTSLELSWQPGVVNVSGSVVYLLKKKFQRGDKTGNSEVTMVFTEPKASLTVQQVCQSVTSTEWHNKLNFYFTVLALTENSSLVQGDMSQAVEMSKPEPVSKINSPSFSFNPSQAPDGTVRVTTTIVPANTSYLSSVTGYTASWFLVKPYCQIPYVRKETIHNDKSKLELEFNLFYKLYATCEHNIQVYSLMNCVSSDSKNLMYNYPGCYKVTGFDQSKCFSFDPPPTSEISRQVGNLTHSSIHADPDYRFRVNITWLQPTYPYHNTTSYKVSYGDASKRNIILPNRWAPEHIISKYGSTILELKGLLPNVEYKFEVIPLIPLAKEIATYGTVKIPELPKNDIKVRNVTVKHLGFSENDSYSFNISWIKPKFPYGTLSGYAIYTKTRNLTTHLAYHRVSGLGHSQPTAIEIVPVYSQSWITGTGVKITLKGDDPNKEFLSVQSLNYKMHEDQINNAFDLMFSWTPPKFKYKTLGFYQVSYSLSGYPYHAIDCKYGKVNKPACGDTITENVTYFIRGVLPSEHVIITVTPMFVNSSFVKGIANSRNVDAPFPRRNLVAVENLTYIGNFQFNGTTVMNIMWKRPQFQHSNVSKYAVTYTIETIKDGGSSRARRAISNKTSRAVEKTVTSTSFSAPVLERGKQMNLEVTPVFEVEIIIGEKKSMTVSNPAAVTVQGKTLSALEISAICFAVFILILMLLGLSFWLIRRQQQIKDGLLVGGKGAIIDLWEVPVDKVFLEEELGEGAFGKVFKAILVELPEQSAKYSIAKSIRRKSLKPLNQDDGFVVAVKMLHDMADNEQRREFLKEIQLMKDVGSHRNIVNMLGCGTLSDPMFLIVEYLPNGDLLHYLRKRRGKVKTYPESDPRGPYHSTYCETYFNKNNPEAGVTLQPSRSDRIYVHSPDLAKELNKGDIQLLSVQEGSNESDSNRFVVNADTCNNKLYDEDVDDGLTPGDLMAFAWQVSQGMEYLAKRGYVHRDLAARNVLVGNNKEAKIADFGLTRHMYENLYQAKTNRKLPLKWMSVEAIFDQSFTSQSDVWAYGVFMWELVTLGGTPYPSINNRELLKLLKEGYRMEKPETCDYELYDIMCSCWKELPEDRPSFEDIRAKLEEMMTRDNPYFDPSAIDESRDYYNVPSFNSAPDPDDDDDIIGDILGGPSSPRDNDYKALQNSKTDIDRTSTTDIIVLDDVTSLQGDPWGVLDNDVTVSQKEEVDLDQVVFDNDQSEVVVSTEQSRNSRKLKYASLDFNDLEFQIYRKQNKGFAL